MLRERATLDKQLNLVRSQRQDYDDAVGLIELAAEEGDQKELAAAEHALKDLREVGRSKGL